MKCAIAFIVGLLAYGSAWAASNPALIPSVPTIAALKALGAAAPQYQTVQLLGYYASGDGGGGILNWSPASTATPEPCVTFQATGVTTGRYIRQLDGKSLSMLQCGVVADSSGTTLATDNTTNLQAALNAPGTYGLGEIYCPATTGKIGFLSTVSAPYTIHGQANTLNPILGVSGNPGACVLLYTGVGQAITFQTPITAVCPGQQGPSYLNFTLQMPNALVGGIKINDPTNAGFTDACNSGATGQSVVSGGVIANLVVACNQRGTIGIGVSKIFNYAVRDNFVNGCDTLFQFDGSDNIDFQHNTMNQPLIQGLNLVGHTTFGNEFHAHQNTFNDLFTNASYNVNSSYGQLILDDNYFEDAQFTGGTAAINLTFSGAGNVVVENNGVFVDPAFTPYWLQVTGTPETLKLSNNFSGGQTAQAFFNGGSGNKFDYSAGLQSIITGGGNTAGDAGIPYFTNSAAAVAAIGGPPAVSGSVLGTFSPASVWVLGGTYGPNVTVNPGGCFVIPYAAGTASFVTFGIRPVVSGTVDVWLYGLLASGSTQTIFVNDGVNASQTPMTTTGAWYHVLSAGDAVTDPTITVGNNDNAHGDVTVQFCAVSLTKH